MGSEDLSLIAPWSDRYLRNRNEALLCYIIRETLFPLISQPTKSADCCVAVLFIPLRVLFVYYYLKCLQKGFWGGGGIGPGVWWGGVGGGSKGIGVKVVFHVDRNNIERFLVLFHYFS